MSSLPYQMNAADVDQETYARDKAKAREARVHDLWRWLLREKMGREFLWEVLLVDIGYDQVVQGLFSETPAVLHERVALHNLGARWMHLYIRRHRDLYLQMLAEATKREDDERREVETKRQEWARREDESA